MQPVRQLLLAAIFYSNFKLLPTGKLDARRISRSSPLDRLALACSITKIRPPARSRQPRRNPKPPRTSNRRIYQTDLPEILTPRSPSMFVRHEGCREFRGTWRNDSTRPAVRRSSSNFEEEKHYTIENRVLFCKNKSISWLSPCLAS